MFTQRSWGFQTNWAKLRMIVRPSALPADYYFKAPFAGEILRGTPELLAFEFAGEPCRICGMTIQAAEATALIYAGEACSGVARAAHSGCWHRGAPRSSWVYPRDA